MSKGGLGERWHSPARPVTEVLHEVASPGTVTHRQMAAQHLGNFGRVVCNFTLSPPPHAGRRLVAGPVLHA